MAAWHMHPVDEAIRNLVETRGRLVTRTEVLTVGGSDRLIANRLERGIWCQVHAGVYLVGIGALRWEERALAVLGGGPGAFASHRASNMPQATATMVVRFLGV